MRKLLEQCRKPTGWLGRLFLWIMNRGHSKLTGWGFQQISVGKGDTILDVGCGGGMTVRKLAAVAAEGKVYGIDHSDQSVAAARRTNRQGIAEGRVEIRQASVSGLPFSDGLFDLVTAVETHYFWPDLPADLREILRVLKAGGTLVILAEAYKGGKHGKWLQKVAEWTKMVFLTAEEHRDLFSTAGYSDVRVTERPDKGWLCAIGRKPPSGPDHEAAGRVIGEAFDRR